MVTGYMDVEWWFLTLLRNGITDPITRGEDSTYSTTYGSSLVFTIPKTRVQNIKTVTVGGVAKKWGYDYTIAYGEGDAATTVTLLATPVGGAAVVITYHNGLATDDKVRDGLTIRKGALIDKGFFRSDNAKPKIMVMKEKVTTERKGIGPLTSRWLNTTFSIEVWSSYATQCKSLATSVTQLIAASEIPPIGPQYGIVEMATEGSTEPYDYQEEFKAYMCLITVEVKHEEVFA